jgi:ligand-binding sensor domain-containing protein/signal transduction histidine kinase
MPKRIPTAGIVFVALLSIFVEHALALDGAKLITQYHLDVWTERDGLPQGSVQAITQTRDGYLWIGTRDGLARFDGVAFTVFRAETTEGLSANDIRALREDKSGRLWIGTFNGGLSSYQAGKFKAYTKKDGLPSNGVLDIFQSSAGTIWFGTWSGVARLESGKFVVYGAAQGFVGQSGWSIAEDARQQVWVASESALNRWTGQRFEPKPARYGLKDSPLREVQTGRDGSLWLATMGEGVFRLAGGKSCSYTHRDGLPDNKVRTVVEDRDGNLWIGTWNGLCRLRNGTFATLSKQDGLPHEHIESLFEDSEGNLWIGTRGGGLARLRDGKFSNYTTREDLSHNFAKCVLEDRDGALWIGTHGGGLSLYRNGRFTKFGTESGLSSPFVWSIEQDRDGNLWVGTGRPAALHLFKDGKFIAYGKQHGLTVRGGIRALAADRHGSLWIGGDGGGLCRFRDGVFTTFTTEDGLPSNLIRVIHEDSKGDLWIGTNDGLCRYREGKFTCFTTEHGLAHNAVYTVFEDSANALWFGTQRGLSRFAADSFRSYTTRDGLFHDVIYRILEDQDGSLWMSSNRGVFSVAKNAFAEFDHGRIRSLPCVSFGLADGMKSVQCEGGSQPAGCKGADGKFWFPTANGVTMIDPRKSRSDLPPPPVFIEQVWIGKEKVDPRSEVRLEPGTRDFRFHYTALSFTAPEKVAFKYKLEGLDQKWVEAETRRVAFYSDIPPGYYRFRVIACNSDGVWNETGASFAFALAPHFYQTAWFYGMCVLGIVALAWSYHFRRMKLARAEFLLVLGERNRIARDLHDTLAQGFAGIAFQLEAVATKLSEAPHQAKQHLNVALQMVRHSIAEARRSVMNLRSSALENGDLGNALAESARQMMAGKQVDVQLTIAGSVRPISGAIENELLRIGQEAITNSLKYARAGKIQIEVDYQEAGILLRIQDDGQGFQLKEAAAENGMHFGLLGMHERARQMGANLSIQSEPGHGTKVVVKVPVHD